MLRSEWQELIYFSGSERFVYQISTKLNYDVNDFASMQDGLG